LRYLMGIDIGTTSTRAIIINAATGKLAAEGVAPYPMRTPHPAWAEQDPADWVKGAAKAIRVALKKAGKGEICAVGLTGQMHSSVFLDDKGQVIRPAILWCDGRTATECDEMTRRVGKQRLLNIARNIALPGFTAPKILWLAKNEPAAFKRVAKVLVTKDYIRYVMTGVFAAEVSDASGMLLLDVAQRRWSPEILHALKIPEKWLASVFESPEVTGHVSREGSRIFGLPEGIPVVGGGGDQAAGAVGNGIIGEGDVTISLGTSGVVFAPSRKPPIATGSSVHAFCHAVPQMWHTMGVMLAAGGSMQWFRDFLRFEKNKRLSYADINALASKSPPGSAGVVFLPYLTGERTPYNDPKARGAFVGLTLSHDITHVARAVMEGVAFGIKDCAGLMRDAGAPMKNVYISGGGATSDLWRRIIASVIERPVKRLEVDQGPAMGAALLAGVGARVWPDVKSATRRALRVKDETEPRKEDFKKYREMYERYRALYPGLAPYFRSGA